MVYEDGHYGVRRPLWCKTSVVVLEEVPLPLPLSAVVLVWEEAVVPVLDAPFPPPPPACCCCWWSGEGAMRQWASGEAAECLCVCVRGRKGVRESGRAARTRGCEEYVVDGVWFK